MKTEQVFRVTAVLPPSPDFWMPTIEQYIALAEALHDGSEDCAANYYVPFSECAYRETDIHSAIHMLVSLRKAGWRLERDPSGTVELGL